MNTLTLASSFALPLGSAFETHNEELYVIFAFVLVLLGILLYFRNQRDRMWHETARIALEKGQPVPNRWGFQMGTGVAGRRGFGHFGYWGPWWEIRRGLVLLAVSGGVYLSMGSRSHGWIAIPACIGAVYLVLGLISLLRGVPNERDDHRDPPAQT